MVKFVYGNERIESVKTSFFPFFLSNVNASPIHIQQQTKASILKDFTEMFISVQTKEAQAALRQNGFSGSDLQKLLSEWRNEGEIGKQYGDALAKTVQNLDIQGVAMEAAFRANLEKKGISIRARNTEAYIEKANTALETIEQQLENYAGTLNSNESLFRLINKINNPFDDVPGKKIPDGVYGGHRTGDKVESSLKNLENIIDTLKAQAAGAKNVGVIRNKGKKNERKISSPLELIRLSASVFKNISGEGYHEEVGNQCANAVKLEEGKIVEMCDTFFERNGAILVTSNKSKYGTGILGQEGKMKGHQMKGDIGLEMQVGKSVSLLIPASFKLRLSPDNLLPDWGLTGFIEPQNVSIGELLGMALNGQSTAWFEQGWGTLLKEPKGKHTRKTVEGDYASFISAWRDFKNASSYLGVYRSLVGTGLKGKNNSIDFAAILVVNDKIFSMYDILSTLGNPNSNVVYLEKNEIPEYMSVREKIVSKMNDKTILMSQRIDNTKTEIKTLYGKKIHIEVNLSML